MKIEVGKIYRTRVGHKVRIYSDDGQEEGTLRGKFHGAKFEDGGWIIGTWFEEGIYVLGIEGRYDIISEWVEHEASRPRMLAWIQVSEGSVLLFPLGQTPNIGLHMDFRRAPWLDEPDNTHKGAMDAI